MTSSRRPDRTLLQNYEYVDAVRGGKYADVGKYGDGDRAEDAAYAGRDTQIRNQRAASHIYRLGTVSTFAD